MIATAATTLPTPYRAVLKNRGGIMRVSDALRDEAANEIAAALDGVSVKRTTRANVPGAGATYLSRCRNGDSANPLFRLASIFVLGRILGVPKERFQRLIDWLQEQLDRAYGDVPADALSDVLDHDAALDPQDEHLRFRAARGCPDAMVELLEVKRRQLAFAPRVIAALRHEIDTGNHTR